jgi:hypothetical protein
MIKTGVIMIAILPIRAMVKEASKAAKILQASGESLFKDTGIFCSRDILYILTQGCRKHHSHLRKPKGLHREDRGKFQKPKPSSLQLRRPGSQESKLNPS